MAITDLRTCLEQELAAINTFIEVLGNERSILENEPGMKPAALDAQVERKNALIDQLGQLSATRDQLLAAQGYASGHAGTEQAVQAHPALAELWQTLLTQVEQARGLNEDNGTFINARLNFTLQVSKALQKSRGTPMYGADGRSRNAMSSGRIGRG